MPALSTSQIKATEGADQGVSKPSAEMIEGG